MKYIYTLFVILLLSYASLFSQDGQENKWNLSSGAGVAYSGADNFGFSMDMDLSRRLFKKIDIGLFFNIMNTQDIVNDLSRGFDGASLLFTARDIDNLENTEFFHSFRRANYYSTGLQLTYDVVDSQKFQFVLGGGYYYSAWSTSFNQITDGGPAGIAFIGYSYSNSDAWRYHVTYQFGYKISEVITAGIKGRYLSIQDELGSYAYIGLRF